MTIDKENLLNSIVESLDRIQYVKTQDIPNIDLYMDQVTTFMERKLKSTTRNPDEDKILTKTMINNYAKNNLLPPPVKKKYSKEHILVLIYIYYFKGILSINDIQALLNPITEKYFQRKEASGSAEANSLDLLSIYETVFGLEKGQVENLKEDIIQKFSLSQETFADAPEKEREKLQLFSFICLLSFDVYVKKLLIEKMVDSFDDVTVKKEKETRADGKERINKDARKK